MGKKKQPTQAIHLNVIFINEVHTKCFNALKLFMLEKNIRTYYRFYSCISKIAYRYNEVCIYYQLKKEMIFFILARYSASKFFQNVYSTALIFCSLYSKILRYQKDYLQCKISVCLRWSKRLEINFILLLSGYKHHSHYLLSRATFHLNE